MEKNDKIVCYTTVEDKNEARLISINVIKKKLAACVNVIDNVNSYYLWNGKACESNELIMLFKTKESKYEELKKVVLKLHSYDTACFLSFRIDRIDENYQSWIEGILS